MGGSSGEVWFVETLGTPPFHVNSAHDPDTPFPHFPTPDEVLVPSNVCVGVCVCVCCVCVWVCVHVFMRANLKLHERGRIVCSRTK